MNCPRLPGVVRRLPEVAVSPKFKVQSQPEFGVHGFAWTGGLPTRAVLIRGWTTRGCFTR